MQLTDLAAAIKKLGRPMHGFSLLIYGPPKVGKTRLAATIAKVPQINRVFLLDTENGHETLLTMFREGVLSETEAAKINVISIQDTAQRPLASETVLKLLTVPKDQVVCEEHGKISCSDPACTSTEGGKIIRKGTTFNITKLDHNDVVIIDSASAFSTSLLNFHCATEDSRFGGPLRKAGWDEYGLQGRDLTSALLIVQACKTNFIVITHELVIDETVDLIDKETGRIKSITIENKFPLIGTKQYSINSGKFFSHIIYMQINNRRHEGGSSTTYKNKVLTGSRGGWQIEKDKNFSLANIFQQLYKVEDDKETATET